jgi:hypothetical protein
MILACLLAEGEEKFFTVCALQTAAKNFDQGKEDFSSVVHGCTTIIAAFVLHCMTICQSKRGREEMVSGLCHGLTDLMP